MKNGVHHGCVPSDDKPRTGRCVAYTYISTTKCCTRPSVHMSVSLSVSKIYSKLESRGNFKFIGDIMQNTSNYE